MGAVSLAGVDKSQGMRAPGFFLAPRPNPYRCAFGKNHDPCDCDYIDFLEMMIKN